MPADSKSADRLRSRMRKMFADRSELTVAELLAEETPKDATAHETRKNQRRPQFREAQIILGPKGGQLSVAVKDLSAGGVRIESFRKLALPPIVEFHEPLSGRRKKARVVWQEDLRAALEFIE